MTWSKHLTRFSDAREDSLIDIIKQTPSPVKRTILILWLADILVGLSYGAVTVALGFPWWVPVLLALFVVAGASEFLFIGIVAGGGTPWLATTAGILVNTRHIPYGFVVEPLLGKGIRKLLGVHVLTDESLSFALGDAPINYRRGAYWLCGLAIAISWPLGTLLGSVVGSSLTNPDLLGLDAVFPAVLLALVVPLVRNKEALICVIGGGIIAVFSSFFLPSGVAELTSLLMVIVIFLWKHGR